jgi:hypothetical protein
MRKLGQPIAFLVAALLLFMLAVVHPVVWLQGQRASDREGVRVDPAAQYVALLEGSGTIREMLRDQTWVGYASESEIDTRVGGPTQARYYLSQFALTPVLVDLEAKPRRGEPDFVLANFEFSEQLSAYLIEQSRRAVVSLNDYVALTRARED